MDQDDFYFYEARNADHRHPVNNSMSPFRPRAVSQPPGTRYPQQTYPAPTVVYQQPSIGSSILGKLTTGQVVAMVAELFAAIQPLPGAPKATTDAAVDVQNMVIYQSALAQHAKRDEQVRTLGSLIARLVG